MASDYNELLKEVGKYRSELANKLPEVMKEFGAMNMAAHKDGAVSAKTKELIAICLAVAARCDGCIGYHTQALIKLGVAKEELVEVLGVAITMGGGPSMIYSSLALKAYDELSRTK